MMFHDLAKVVRNIKDSRHRTGMASRASERASKTMGIDIENELNDELEPKLSWVKGGP